MTPTQYVYTVILGLFLLIFVTSAIDQGLACGEYLHRGFGNRVNVKCLVDNALEDDNPQECDSKDDKSKANCLMQYAIAKSDITACPSHDQQYQTTCILDFARKTLDPAHCDIYLGEEYQMFQLEYCTGRNPSENCQGYSEFRQRDSYNNCIHEIVKSGGDSAFCERIIIDENPSYTYPEPSYITYDTTGKLVYERCVK